MYYFIFSIFVLMTYENLGYPIQKHATQIDWAQKLNVPGKELKIDSKTYNKTSYLISLVNKLDGERLSFDGRRKKPPGLPKEYRGDPDWWEHYNGQYMLNDTSAPLNARQDFMMYLLKVNHEGITGTVGATLPSTTTPKKRKWRRIFDNMRINYIRNPDVIDEYRRNRAKKNFLVTENTNNDDDIRRMARGPLFRIEGPSNEAQAQDNSAVDDNLFKGVLEQQEAESTTFSWDTKEKYNEAQKNLFSWDKASDTIQGEDRAKDGQWDTNLQNTDKMGWEKTDSREIRTGMNKEDNIENESTKNAWDNSDNEKQDKIDGDKTMTSKYVGKEPKNEWDDSLKHESEKPKKIWDTPINEGDKPKNYWDDRSKKTWKDNHPKNSWDSNKPKDNLEDDQVKKDSDDNRPKNDWDNENAKKNLDDNGPKNAWDDKAKKDFGDNRHKNDWNNYKKDWEYNKPKNNWDDKKSDWNNEKRKDGDKLKMKKGRDDDYNDREGKKMAKSNEWDKQKKNKDWDEKENDSNRDLKDHNRYQDWDQPTKKWNEDNYDKKKNDWDVPKDRESNANKDDIELRKGKRFNGNEKKTKTLDDKDDWDRPLKDFADDPSLEKDGPRRIHNNEDTYRDDDNIGRKKKKYEDYVTTKKKKDWNSKNDWDMKKDSEDFSAKKKKTDWDSKHDWDDKKDDDFEPKKKVKDWKDRNNDRDSKKTQNKWDDWIDKPKKNKWDDYDTKPKKNNYDERPAPTKRNRYEYDYDSRPKRSKARNHGRESMGYVRTPIPYRGKQGIYEDAEFK